jgi:glycosyltransferase involved in cell wall biosynthesis
MIIVVDKPDAATHEYLANTQTTSATIELISLGDPGLARNRGVEIASGRYVTFLDGDDLMCGSWLAAAWQRAAAEAEECVYYPEYVIRFEGENLVWRPYGSRDEGFRATNLIENNCWNSVHFLCPRQLLEQYPFQKTDLTQGFGYEDWLWYSETVARGTEIVIVPGTCIFSRKKRQGSQYSASELSNAVVPASRLFEPALFAQLLARDKETDNRPPMPTTGEPTRFTREQMALTLAQRLTATVDGGFGRAIRTVLAASPPVRGKLKRLLKPFRERASSRRFPEWLLAEWREMHKLEPIVFPDPWLVQEIYAYEVPRSTIAESYIDLCRRIGDDVSHVVLVPWLKTGGSDLETLNYVNALVDESLARRVVVIATHDADSPWAERLPPRVRFIPFGRLYAALSREEQERLLARTWLQLCPTVVHIINSELGLRVMVRHGRALRTVSRVFMSTFCPDFTLDGKTDGYPFRYLPDCVDNLDGIFFDNQTFLDALAETYGLDRRKLHLHYQPAPLQTLPPPSVPRETSDLRVLWAGRLDRQKRPDILLDVADASRSLPAMFHVYGSVVLDEDRYTKEFSRRANVVYHGPFESFSAIPTQTYDLYLHTAQWEGLPNILMEAIGAQLPIMAADVGGVRELIRDGESGYLISPFDDVSQYVCRLEAMCCDPDLLGTTVAGARALVAQRHGWDQFVASVKAVPGYSAPPEYEPENAVAVARDVRESAVDRVR